MGRSTSTGKLAALYLPVICQLGYNFRLAAAADVVVGGAEGWVDGPQYNPLQVQVGDVLVRLGKYMHDNEQNDQQHQGLACS